MESEHNQEAKTLHDVLATFRNFNVEQWTMWLNAFLNCESHEPQLLLGAEELDAILLGLYEELRHRTSRSRFADALVRVYESTPFIEGHEEVLYLQISLIAAITPIRAKNLLKRQLLDQQAFNIQFEQNALDSEKSTFHKPVESAEDLHTMILSALGQYDVDDSIVAYIQQSAKSIRSYNYLLVCFRVLSTVSEDIAIEFLEELIPRITSEVEAEDLACELKAEFVRTGARCFCEWYCANANSFESEWSKEFALFEDKLRDVALPRDAGILAKRSDKYVHLLGLQLLADKVSYSAADLLQIGRLYKYFDVEIITNALRNIWRRSQRRLQTPPWSFVSVYERFVGGSRQSNQRAIEVITPDEKVDWQQFNAVDEPELEIIFERVKTWDVAGVDLLEIENRNDENLDSYEFTAST